MEDLQARLEKLLTDAEDCALIGKLATDVRKRDLFNRLAADLRRYGIRCSSHDCVEARGAGWRHQGSRSRVETSAASAERLMVAGQTCVGPQGPQNLLVRQRIGPHLDVHGARLSALAAFLEPRRAVAARAPQAAALPAGVRIVDAAVETLGVEAHRIRDAQHDHLPVLEARRSRH